MANSDQYCLYSPDFQTRIGMSLKELYRKKDFCDVTLACQDKRIHAHKFIIASSSPILRNFLKQNLNRHPVIPLGDVKCKDLENLLKFMYEGEVNIDPDDLDGFFKIAENLKIRGLFKENEGISSPPLKRKTFSKGDFEDNLSLDHGNQMATNSFPETTEENAFQEGFYDGNFIASEKQLLTYQNFFGQSDENYGQNMIFEKSDKKEKKFDCLKCFKKFTTKYVLSRHIEAIHEGIVYSCDQCEKSFGQAANLWKHKTFVHEGKRYSCDQCDYKSTQKAYLRTHIKKHHKIEMKEYRTYIKEYPQAADNDNGLHSNFDLPITSEDVQFIENAIKTEVVENENGLNSEYDASNSFQMEESPFIEDDDATKTEVVENENASNSFQMEESPFTEDDDATKTEVVENENGLNPEYDASDSYQFEESHTKRCY